MFTSRTLKYIAFFVSGISWVLLTLFYCIDGGIGQSMGIQFLPMGDSSLGLLKFTYYGSLMLLISKLFEESTEEFKPLPSMWRLFTVGLLSLVIITVLVFFNYSFKPRLINADYVSPILYSISNAAIAFFLIWATFTFRRFVLYQKSRRKVAAWSVFRAFTLVALLLTGIPQSLTGETLNSYLTFGFSPLVVLVAFALSIDNEWTTYLSFQEKLKVLGAFVLLLVFFVFFFFMRVYLASIFEYGNRENNNFLFDSLGSFCTFYAIISALILFINIPTSSAFEIKNNVLSSFNKVVLDIQANSDNRDILESLIHGSLLTANAQWGWIHLRDKDESWICKHQRGEAPIEVLPYVDDENLRENVLENRKFFLVKNTKKRRVIPFFSWGKDFSLICVPIYSSNHNFGTIIIAKEYGDAFEEHVIQNLVSFAEQTGISIENSKIVKNAIALERYREHLKIAQEVQDELLPKKLPQNQAFELHVYNQNADEVGGDYYDFVQKGDLFKVAVGDISGKGTTAAFYMAEFKGIFHTLANMDLSVKDVIITANQSLISCLPKSLFMTLTYLQINTNTKQLSFIRAGHCPTLYYNSRKDELLSLREGTLGLGISKPKTFSKLVKNPEEITYHANDFMVLYTDGITEARNAEKEEFGNERLQELIFKNRHVAAKDLLEIIVKQLHKFVGGTPKHDDLTLMIIRFL
ncbi:MAG: GAF domain-containing SpoIIE family protein phosphatase [Bacteroidia bacterium]